MPSAKLTPPPRSAPTSTEPDESHHLVRERRFSPTMSLDEIAHQIRESHSTGTLHVDFASGGIGSIRFREERRVTFDENNP